jgi:hypothetical protein
MHYAPPALNFGGRIDFQLHVCFLFPHVVLMSVADRCLFSAVSVQLAVDQTWQGPSCIPEAALHRPGSVNGR